MLRVIALSPDIENHPRAVAAHRVRIYSRGTERTIALRDDALLKHGVIESTGQHPRISHAAANAGWAEGLGEWRKGDGGRRDAKEICLRPHCAKYPSEERCALVAFEFRLLADSGRTSREESVEERRAKGSRRGRSSGAEGGEGERMPKKEH